MTRYPLVIHAMLGLGDSFYQRPFVRAHAEDRGVVYLRTSWPEFFEDIEGVRFVMPDSTELRTQVKNMQRQDPDRWVVGPMQAERIRATYRLESRADSIVEELRRVYRVPRTRHVRFDAPDFGRSPVRYKRYAVIRPVTHRKEWLNPARSPDPRYVARAAELLQTAGYRVVSVADIEGRTEWMEGSPPVADREFLRGELGPRELGALVQNAAVVVGGVGWVVPMSIACGTPAVFIGGGQGGYNAPGVVTDRRIMDLGRIRWLLPDRYCDCRRRLHACPKEISDFDARFGRALSAVDAPAEAAA